MKRNIAFTQINITITVERHSWHHLVNDLKITEPLRKNILSKARGIWFITSGSCMLLSITKKSIRILKCRYTTTITKNG